MDREGYHVLEGKAVAECERGLNAIRAARPANLNADERDGVRLAGLAQVGFGLTLAVLAVAERLDVLIDCAFDRRVAVRVEAVEGGEVE